MSRARRRGRVVRQRPAKPRTAVRVRSAPNHPYFAGISRFFGLTVFISVPAERLDRLARARPRGMQVDLGHTRRRVPQELLHRVQVALGRVEHVTLGTRRCNFLHKVVLLRRQAGPARQAGPGGTRGRQRGGNMVRKRFMRLAAVVVGALVAAVGVYGAAAAPPTGTDASEVTHWNQVAAANLAQIPGPNGGAPPAFQINMGMVQGAVYDAVNAIGPKQHRPYLLNRRTGAKASIDAAVATAAYDVLSELVSTAPERAPFPGRAGLLNTLSSAYAASLAAIDDDSFKNAGHRDRTRGSRGHARRERGRRAVRAVSVGAEPRCRTLAAALNAAGRRPSTRRRGQAT